MTTRLHVGLSSASDARAVAREAVSAERLGLPIARRIAVLHGGSLVVESTVGVGSVFTLRISRRLAEVRTISTSPPGR